MADTAEIRVFDPWDVFLRRGLLGLRDLVRNAPVEISVVRAGMREVPLVTNREGNANCSWVASLRNSYGPYARAETDIVRMNRLLRPLYLAASHAAETMLSVGGLSGGNFLNNWLMATNLYPDTYGLAEIQDPMAALCRRDPLLPVVIRSLTPALHGGLLEALGQAGFLLLPSRQVWLFHDPASGHWRKHRDSRRDLALMHSTASRWAWVEGKDFTDRDFSRAHRLYQRLYRERYPPFNPDYSEDYLRVGVQTGFLDIFGLRSTDSDTLCGFAGMAHRGSVSCTAVLGYDIDAPSSDGLYRRLMLRALLACEARGSALHASAGAGLFKFNRGARSHVEFAAIWANHLPVYRRANLKAVAAAVNRWVVPYLQAHRF